MSEMHPFVLPLALLAIMIVYGVIEEVFGL